MKRNHKIKHLEELAEVLGDHQRLEIDGGVDSNTVRLAAGAGADTLVAGTAVFGAPDPGAACAELQRLAVESFRR